MPDLNFDDHRKEIEIAPSKTEADLTSFHAEYDVKEQLQRDANYKNGNTNIRQLLAECIEWVFNNQKRRDEFLNS